MKDFIKHTGKQVGLSLLRWTWTKGVLFWIIISAGTFSELAFLLASMWKSVNASEHSFVLLFMSQKMSENVGYFASSAYILLPVCILPLGVVTVYSHLRTWTYSKKFFHASGVWTLLYGLPTLTFLIIDICVISNSNSDHYILPDFLVSIRSVMAYAYGLTAILYHYIGKKQETDRLKEKDDFISQLVEQARVLTEQREQQRVEMQAQIDNQKAEMEQQKTILAESKKQQHLLLNEAKKGSEAALEAYGEDCVEWLSSGLKTVSIDDISRYTGHSKQKIRAAKLAHSPRNKDLILTGSLVLWLKNTPAPTNKTEVSPDYNSHKEMDTEPINFSDYAETSV